MLEIVLGSSEKNAFFNYSTRILNLSLIPLSFLDITGFFKTFSCFDLLNGDEPK